MTIAKTGSFTMRLPRASSRDFLSEGEMRFWMVFHFTFFWIVSIVGIWSASFIGNETAKNIVLVLSIPLLTFCYGLMIEGAWLSWYHRRH